jgi:hypothetical protein
LPETYRDFTAVEKNVPVLEIGSEFGHMEIVTSGRVLPVLLHRSPLRSIKPPRFTQPKPTQDAKPAPKP